MPASEEAWCRNPGCDLHGMTIDDGSLARCPSCGRLLALEEVRVPIAPVVHQAAKALA